MQALVAGGAALCHQWFRGMENLGLEDGQTCVVWRTFPELVDKFNHYLNREDERARIAEAGKALAMERHSFDRRVDELFLLLSEEGEDWR
jgi:spore maturation protein CgeB